MAIVFLLRFQALRYCGTAALILAELSGNIAFRFWKVQDWDRDRNSRVCGFFALFTGLFLLSVSWDRMDCFPLSYSNLDKIRSSFMVVVGGNCLRIVPMLLPFLSGFLGCYERDLMNRGTIRQLGRKRVQLISLFFTTSMLFFPAIINMLVFEAEGGSVSVVNLGWLLANTVLFGVLLNEWNNDEKWVNPRESEKEFFITFVSTLVLELVYFPELSLWGLLICGSLLWVAIQQLNWNHARYVELGAESSETFSSMVMRPIRHVLSERKSRKIALFLMINTGYMVVEFVAGFMSNSLGLISDACHMLFDCAALAIGLYASYISRLPANSQFNYGRGRFEVLSGYVNAVLLVLVGALIVLESLERILDPQEISTNSLLVVSVGGLLVNVGLHIHPHHDDNDVCKSIAKLPGADSCSHSHHLDSKTESSRNKMHHHQHIDHNMEGIFLHVLADTLGSVGVVISTLLIKYKGWLVADPACSIFISVLIVSSVIPLLRNSAEILLQRVPRAHEQDLRAAVNDVMKIKGVSGIQNLHVWSLTNTDVIGTLHLRVSSEIDKAATKSHVMHTLQDAGVKDLTLQVESLKSL
uniref:Cation efflux protein transmembrane domain-containing protein n=1 Tax=Chenopodium quinoa TaxID=63459 RepID=A0A803L243_CHEQI